MAEQDKVTVGDRRPLKTRETGWAKRMASWLAQRGASPNSISVAGMIAAILGGFFLAATARWHGVARLAWLLGARMVQFRLLANMLDGMVAIESNRTSLVGDLYNEVPDRISDIAILVGLGWAVGGNALLGLAVAMLAVLTAYVRAQGKASGAQNEFCGPMAKPQRMFAVTVTALYCVLTPLSWQSWLGAGPATWVLWLIGVGCLITVGRRLMRIARTLNDGGNHG
ncbi:MAG: CDP-alcohol phosphatidyltransferase family protein [Pontiellaceae bacterium]|nr:CDP-alcohol phosphatidyltransferase family protein [Pontiellaceae bacterium]